MVSDRARGDRSHEGILLGGCHVLPEAVMGVAGFSVEQKTPIIVEAGPAIPGVYEEEHLEG
jgi:hypothetical protein